MSTQEHSLFQSRISRRSLLIGGGAAALGLATARSSSLARFPTPYANPDGLVSAAWVMQHADQIKLVAFMPVETFEAGHIPGSARIDAPELTVASTADASITAWQSQVEGTLTRLNLAPGDTVVIYDDGSLFGARLWWILDLLGHADKRILNGGMAAWQAARGEIETGPSTVTSSAGDYAGTLDHAKLATRTDVLMSLGDPRFTLIDAREAAAFQVGHIPHAINYDFSYNAEAGPVAVWKSADLLNALYAGLGITPDKRVVSYCYSGVHSCVTYFTLKMLGYPDVRVYTGSWDEWKTNPYYPREAGSSSSLKNAPVRQSTQIRVGDSLLES